MQLLYMIEKLPDGSISHSDRSLSMVIPPCAVGVAYLWETTPVLATKALPIYANDEFELPGAPWLIKVEI